MNLLRPVAALVLSALALAAQAAPMPSHVYLLDGSYADQNGGPPLGNDGGTLDATGYSFGINQGLSLSNVLGTTYTIDFQSSFTNVSGYRKLVDFKDRNSDNGLYNNSTRLNFYPVATGPAGAFAPNVLSRVTITRDNTSGIFMGYVNGLQQITFNDTGNLATFSGAAQIARFFEDDFVTGGGEASAGRVEYIRLFNTALSATDVAGLADPAGPGPVSPVPEPQTLALMMIALLSGAGVTQARKR